MQEQKNNPGGRQQTGLKTLPPTLRSRQRYLVFEAIGAQAGREEIAKAIFNTGMRFIGEHEYSRTKAWLMDFDQERQKGIIRFAHTHKKGIKAVLLLINDIGGRKIILHALGISGTVKKARKKWF